MSPQGEGPASAKNLGHVLLCPRKSWEADVAAGVSETSKDLGKRRARK